MEPEMTESASEGPRAVIAVISVFNAPAELPARVELALDQVDHVVLVDDGSHTVDRLDFASERVHTILLDENSGIARALNVGIEHAVSLGATHLLTLDQDSDVRSDHVAQLLAALDGEAERGSAPVVAAVPGRVGGAAIPMLKGEPLDPVQSGQLLIATAFRSVGGFREDLFIDAVDSEFTARARSRGFRFVAVEALAMDHSLGELVPLRLFGRRLAWGGQERHALYHRAFRTYYMVRNSSVVARTYRRSQRRWVFLRNRRMLELVVVGVLFGAHRKAQLRAILMGVRDARSSRLGRIPEGDRAMLARMEAV